jgi:hypothetical protein
VAGSVARVSEPTGPGMGRPSGPGFTGPSQPDLSQPTLSTAPTVPAPGDRAAWTAAPPSRRLPAVITVLAIGVVAAVVTVASVLAARQDVREVTPPPVTSRSGTVGPVATDRIEFTTSSGSGVLEIVDHGWDSDGSHTDQPGSLLTVAIELTCQSGTLSYGPDSFQAFDRDGDLFEPEVVPASATVLEVGTLSAGQQVSGTVAFDIPRGGVTLLMSDDSSRTVTALKVPD